MLEKEGTNTRHADEAAGGGLGAGQAHQGERDHRLGLGHEHDGLGALYAGEAGADALLLRQPGDHGVRAAVCDCGADRVSGPAGDRGGRRWRIHDADGRDHHGGRVQAADQAGRSSRTTRWARSSGSRWCSREIRSTSASCFRSTLLRWPRRVGANGVRIDDPKTAGEQFDKALAMPGPVIIEAVVDPVHRDAAGEDQAGAGAQVLARRCCVASRTACGSRLRRPAIPSADYLTGAGDCLDQLTIRSWKRTSATTIPTDAPEADGTIAWDSTTLIVVHVEAGDADAASDTPMLTALPQSLRVS